MIKHKFLIFLFIFSFILLSASTFSESNTPNANYLLGKFNPAKHKNFISIPKKYLVYKRKIYLRKETYAAFNKMAIAAKKDGIYLFILSGTRNFYVQKWIWERKWNGKTKVIGKNLKKEVPNHIKRARYILLYSSMPGTSRHHWGTDIDINKLENSYFKKGYGRHVYTWLKKNAPRFGFCQTYSPKGKLRPYGYELENWHWSYIPLAKKYLQAYNKLISYKVLKGFAGAHTAEKLDVIKKYVNGINPKCLK